MSISMRTEGPKQGDEVQRKDVQIFPWEEKKDERDKRKNVHLKSDGENFIAGVFSSIVR